MIAPLFYILVALFPLGVLARLQVLPAVTVSVQDLVVFLILLLSAKSIFRYIKNKRLYVLLFGLFFTVGMCGLFVHTHTLFEFLSSVSYLVRLFGYILLIIPLVALKKSILSRLKIEMVISGFIFVALGYVQYLYYPDLRNISYLGWDEHLYRLFSTFLDPNFTGAFIALVVFLYSYFFFSRIKKDTTIQKALFMCGYIFLLPALLLTYSRGAFVMFSISSVVFLVLLKQIRILLVLGVFAVVGLFFLPQDLGGEGVNLMRTSTIVSRTQVNVAAMNIFVDNPLVGVGFNALRFVSQEYNFLGSKDVYASHAAAGIPNSFLFVLATTGTLGFVLFAILFFKIFQNFWKNYRHKKQVVFTVCVLASFIGVFIDSIFENSLFFIPILLWLVLLLGIYVGEEKGSKIKA